MNKNLIESVVWELGICYIHVKSVWENIRESGRKFKRGMWKILLKFKKKIKSLIKQI